MVIEGANLTKTRRFSSRFDAKQRQHGTRDRRRGASNRVQTEDIEFDAPNGAPKHGETSFFFRTGEKVHEYSENARKLYVVVGFYPSQHQQDLVTQRSTARRNAWPYKAQI